MEVEMPKEHFEILLTYTVDQVIAEIAQRHNFSEIAASRLLLNSKLYKLLENEETKLWHLSYMALCLLFDEELDNGYFEIPEET
jgi:uncharacterized HAD superfamily protein